MQKRGELKLIFHNNPWTPLRNFLKGSSIIVSTVCRSTMHCLMGMVSRLLVSTCLEILVFCSNAFDMYLQPRCSNGLQIVNTYLRPHSIHYYYLAEWQDFHILHPTLYIVLWFWTIESCSKTFAICSAFLSSQLLLYAKFHIIVWLKVYIAATYSRCST